MVPYPPLWVFYHFVSRDTISGGVMGLDQKISRKEALQVETINNAYLTFEERIKGSIEPGKLADLVVLPEDILTCPEKQIEQIKKVSGHGDLDEGLRAEGEGFGAAFGSEDAKEGIGAFLGKRQAKFEGK